MSAATVQLPQGRKREILLRNRFGGVNRLRERNREVSAIAVKEVVIPLPKSWGFLGRPCGLMKELVLEHHTEY